MPTPPSGSTSEPSVARRISSSTFRTLRIISSKGALEGLSSRAASDIGVEGRFRRGMGGDVIGRVLLARRRQRPAMPERVANRTVALAPEHLLDGHLLGRPGGDRPPGGLVRVVEFKQQEDRRPADALGSQGAKRRRLLADQETA